MVFKAQFKKNLTYVFEVPLSPEKSLKYIYIKKFRILGLYYVCVFMLVKLLWLQQQHLLYTNMNVLINILSCKLSIITINRQINKLIIKTKKKTIYNLK